jgi:hypothetical protein
MFILEIMVLKPVPAGQPGPGRPRLEPGRVEEKIEKEKIRCDLVDPARPGQKLDCNPLIFFFLPEFLHRQIH